ncbi:diguanylate cyclase domain-containing protein [Bacillota bacterium Lsc_1132]
METLKRDLIVQLKDCFLDLIDAESETLRFESFVRETLAIILQMFHLETIALYRYQDWKQQFDLEGYVNDKENNPMVPISIRLKELKGFGDRPEILRKPFPDDAGFDEYDFYIELIRKNRDLGFLAIKDKQHSLLEQIDDEQLRNIADDYSSFLGKIQSLTKIVNEKNKYKQLFRVTEKFHSSMDMDELLGEIILTLKEVYPTFAYYLLLSQDNHTHSELPIKDLEYDSENIAAMQAYVTGMIQFEDSVLQRRSILYAPLKGKQGVYGVLQVIAPNTVVFPKNEVEFITLLAHTAGSALENAQLYQQSKKLIADLQLINETSRCLNSNLRLTETINYMTEQIIRSFDAEEVGFFLLSPERGKAKILPGSTAFFRTKQASSYIYFIDSKIQKEKDSLFIGDLNFQQVDGAAPFRSVMAVPMDQGEILKGFVIVMHPEPYYFSFETFKLLQSLIHHSTLAFTNSMLREELELMIITDHLTKLHSRNYLDEKMKRSMKEDEQGAFILIDIDNFKTINDTHGHQIGDEVLVQVANLIKSNIRESDVGARWGGEELAIYLPRVSLATGVGIAERLVEKVAELSNPHVTVSCGVSYWSKERMDTAKFLFKRADEALYAAKRTGKNKVVTQEERFVAS